MIYTVYFSDIIQKKHAYTPFAVSSHINKILKFLSSMLWKALSSMLLKNFPIMVTYRWLTTEMRLEFKIPRIPIFMATASWSVPGWRQYVQMGALVDDRSHAQSTSSWRGFNLNRKCLRLFVDQDKLYQQPIVDEQTVYNTTNRYRLHGNSF